MGYRFSKATVLTLYGYCRQAERSLDNALSCPETWTNFLTYYDAPKQRKIRELIDMLSGPECHLHNAPSRDSFQASPFLAFFSAAVNLLLNKVKKSWTLSRKESTFIARSLQQLIGILNHPGPPATQAVIDLRMELHQCGLIIKHRLIGLPQLRIAERIEHFNQSDYVKHCTFQDLGIPIEGTVHATAATK